MSQSTANLVNLSTLQSADQQFYRILAGQLFDSYQRILVPNQTITVDRKRGVISCTRQENDDEEGETEVIDLRHLVVLPGFVDAHVHLFLHPYSEMSWTDQITRESLAERTLRAGTHAWKTLQAGFTTVRDLGTEGALDADLALRKCMANDNPSSGQEPIVHCANRAIIATGSYGPKSEPDPSADGVEGVMGAEIADGKEGCVRAVRRQIGAGADWIKVVSRSSIAWKRQVLKSIQKRRP